MIDYPAQRAFGPELVALMSGALEDAWKSLQQAGTTLTEEAREVLAKRIVELTIEGEHDRGRLRDGALAALAEANLRKMPRQPV